MKHRKWSELSIPERCAIVGAGLVQIGLAGGAWWDLSRRPADAVRGTKETWALVIAINFIGPLAYLRFGRKPIHPVDEPA
ncbi:PLDc_N domain-containing protein [Amycolatopsis sp. K13G38]|uniref:PLDc_N domain-containing protein n=1 Tax=Amycolatopsis acididurans TaxID=2724524 RepID=A0ABX1J0E8_9PSEU|nr:PLDc N-terminal domain-containing protein [Amycolatopsis acididurans]NKQ51835.1 PLDc_N domain-containing protein [Amycolatopsis acididurans]